MKPINFPEETCMFAKGQPQYCEIPVYVCKKDSSGRLVFCWGLTLSERIRVLLCGKIWQQVLTFGYPLQPQLLSVEKPDMPTIQNVKHNESA